jgi:hypothetical protein
VDWAFGLISVGSAWGQRSILYFLGLPIVRLPHRDGSAKRPASVEAPSERPQGAGHAGLLRRLMAFRRHRSHLMDMLGRMASTVGLELTISGTIGTGDPANDAWLLLAMRAAEELPGVQLHIDVEWLEEELECDVVGSASVWLIHVLALGAWLLIRRENRMALRAIA